MFNIPMGHSLTLCASGDKRFNKNHFIMSDVNKKFLLKNQIVNMSVKDFKSFVRKQKPEFKALAGSYLTNVKRVSVYNIETIKQLLKEKNWEQK